MPKVSRQLVDSNLYIQSNKAWGLTDAASRKLTGEGVTIAIIDTGIDYFHADFGGSGNPTDYSSDDPATTGSKFPTAKVIAGYDLAGDNYDADGSSGSATPNPDPDPLDCNGHGTHVAGIAAGQGVRKSNGSTYTGPYNSSALTNTGWHVPPGVAPKASLVALKIFGCSGSSNLVVDAIEQAVAMGGVDVINMSLGSIFARNDDAIALAVAGARDAGIVVVGSAGNSGPSAYIHGGVTTGDAGIAVAAIEAVRNNGSNSNPDYKYLAYFTSGGARNGDSALKPDITAPGVDVLSASAGDGTKGVKFSGTSMASPVVAGAAALVIQEHPAWTPAEVKAALMSTTGAGLKKFRPGQYDPRLAGSGALNAYKAASSVGFVTAADPGGSSLSFGYDEISGSFSEQRSFTIVNRSSKAVSYKVLNQFIGPSRGATVSFSRTNLTVGPNSSETINVTLALSAGAVRSLPGAFTPEEIANNAPSAPFIIYQALSDITGVIKAKPTLRGGNRYPLRLPWLAVPRGVSDVAVTDTSGYTSNGTTASFNATLTNSSSTGNHSANADIFAWGLQDSSDGWEGSDLRAAGVQQFTCQPVDGCASDDRLMYFAVNTWGRWSTLSTEEFDVLIDVNDDDVADYAVFDGDFGWNFYGAFDGTHVVITCSLNVSGECNGLFYDGFIFPEGQPLNGATTLLPTIASWMGLSSASNKIRYTVASTNILPSEFALTDWIMAENNVDLAWAPWHPWQPAVNSGAFHQLGPGQSVVSQLSVNLADNSAHGSPRGWMIVALDDPSGAGQADLVPIGAFP